MPDIVLLSLAALAAATISGAAGFGGALLLLPLLVAKVGPDEAVPLLTVVQLIGNLSRAGFGFRMIHWRPVAVFLLGAIPLCLAGAFSFVQLPKEAATRTIGATILTLAALRYFGVLKLKAGNFLLIGGGAITGLLSGLAGSAGPLGASVFLTLGLPPVAYIASEATSALAIHAAKMMIFQHFITLDGPFWLLAAVMGTGMIIGTWLAKKLIERLPQAMFRKLVFVLLVILAGYMLIHG